MNLVVPPPQTFAVPPPPQVCGAVHVPQESVPPQPFDTDPQLAPAAAQVVGVHPPPQTFAVPPPPQVCGVMHVPQESVPPQPFEIEPQFFPWAAQVVGVQRTHAPFESTKPPLQVITHCPCGGSCSTVLEHLFLPFATVLQSLSLSQEFSGMQVSSSSSLYPV